MSERQPTGPWSQADIDRMLELLPILEDPSFTAATWPVLEPKIVDGVKVVQLPYPIYAPEIERLWELCYRTSCFTPPYEVLPEDPPGLELGTGTLEVLNSVRAMETATLAQLRRYFVLCTRSERFCDGYIAGQIESGIFVAALRRLRDLATRS